MTLVFNDIIAASHAMSVPHELLLVSRSEEFVPLRFLRANPPSRRHGSILPTLLIYIVPSIRGYSLS